MVGKTNKSIYSSKNPAKPFFDLSAKVGRGRLESESDTDVEFEREDGMVCIITCYVNYYGFISYFDDCFIKIMTV